MLVSSGFAFPFEHGALKDTYPLFMISPIELILMGGFIFLGFWLFRNGRKARAGKRLLAFLGFGVGLAALFVLFQSSNPPRSTQKRNRQMGNFLASNPMPQKDASDFTSNLPIIVLESLGGYLSKEDLTLFNASFYHADGQRTSLSSTPQHSGLISAKLRGYSTLRLPKNSLTIHTLDSHTNQTKVSLFGLPADEDWVLQAPFEDKTLIRDALAFDLTRQMGRYAPRTRHVELFIKRRKGAVTMRDYQGIYVLIEKIKRGKERVDIAKLTPSHKAEPDITGGYIFKRDHQDRPENRFQTRHGGPYFFVTPKSHLVTPAQRTWLNNYMNSFENSLYGPEFADPEKGYAGFLDTDAFIDAHWLIEFSKNVDGFRYSSFLTKDRNGKLKTEPPWDWNRSFGNADYYDGWKENGWYWPKLRSREISWYRRLREDPHFAKKAADRWVELRSKVFSPQNVHATIDRLTAPLQEAQKRNFERWPVLWVPITCNYFVGDTYEEEIQWLKSWVEKRIRWMDKQVAVERSQPTPPPQQEEN